MNWIILLLNHDSIYLLFSFSILKWRNKTHSNSSKTNSNYSQWMCPSELFFNGELKSIKYTIIHPFHWRVISFSVFPFPLNTLQPCPNSLEYVGIPSKMRINNPTLFLFVCFSFGWTSFEQWFFLAVSSNLRSHNLFQKGPRNIHSPCQWRLLFHLLLWKGRNKLSMDPIHFSLFVIYQ